jgi:hypothetical protein
LDVEVIFSSTLEGNPPVSIRNFVTGQLDAELG